MRYFENEKGVALVTALMFTALALVISLSLLYLVTTGIQTSAALKRYRTALDATYGGTEIMVKDVINSAFGFADYSSSHAGANFPDYLKSTMGTLATNASVSDCLHQRMTLPRTKWSGNCANVNLNPKNAPDVSFQLGSTTGTPYIVYSKLVDTMERKFLVYEGGSSKTVTIAGNSDTSTFSLEGGSTTEGGGVTVPHYPYVYRVEVQGERVQNPQEKAKVSVMYAY